MRVLILGATGLLGLTMHRRWSARGWSVVGTGIGPVPKGFETLDLLEFQQTRDFIRKCRADVVVCSASNPHVDFCEKNHDETRRLNVDAALEAGRAAREAGARFVFFSSDYVFDGEKGGYREDDPVSPLNAYGRQNRAVEEELLDWGEDALTVRLCGLFGWELVPRNFVLQVLSRLRDGRGVQGVVDQVYTPTYVEFLERAVGDLVEKKASGLFHLAGADAVNREEFARRIAEAFGLEGDIRGVKTSETFRPGAAPRPERSTLDCSKAAAVVGPMPGLQDSLRRMAESESSFSRFAGGFLPKEGAAR
ncbi:MAG: SDR family oxidoreductase [Elusimicrobiota bacterium]